MNIDHRPETSTGYLQLIFLSSEFRSDHRRGLHEQLVQDLGKWSKIVFVESPYSILIHTLKFRSINSSSDNPVSVVGIFTPWILFHNKIWKKLRVTFKIDTFLIARQLRNFMKKHFPGSSIIVWADSPFNLDYIKLLPRRLLIYDFYDNFSFDQDGTYNKFTGQLNKNLIQESNLIFCTAKILFEFAKNLNSNSFYLPNGYAQKNEVTLKNTDINLNGKIIGYLGNIRDWIDFELLRRLLLQLRGDQYLLMIGPVENNVRHYINEFRNNKHFKYLSKVDYDSIYSYIRNFDIGIIPFKINSFTEGVLPYKFFEYVACDIKIVSTALPALLDYSNAINVAADDDEFISMCTSNSDGLNKDEVEYKKIREESTWEKRAGFMEEKIFSQLKMK